MNDCVTSFPPLLFLSYFHRSKTLHKTNRLCLSPRRKSQTSTSLAFLSHSSQNPSKLHPLSKISKKSKKNKKEQKHTTVGIRWWSPTQLLIYRSEACVWQSGRDAQFSSVYGRMCQKSCVESLYWEWKRRGRRRCERFDSCCQIKMEFLARGGRRNNKQEVIVA